MKFHLRLIQFVWQNKLDLWRRSIGAFKDELLLQPCLREEEMMQGVGYGVRLPFAA